MIGPHANQFVLKDPNQTFSSVLAYEPFLKDLFPGTLGVKDFEDHARHRRILQSAFHKKCLVGYVELLNELSIEQMKSWACGPVLQEFCSGEGPTSGPGLSSLLGQTLNAETRRLGKLFLNLVSASTAVVRLPLGFTTYGRGLEAKEALWEFLEAELPQRRSELTADLFSHVAHAVSEDGREAQ